MTASTSTAESRLADCPPAETLRRLRIQRGKSRERLALYVAKKRPLAASSERQLLARLEAEIGTLAARCERCPRS